MCKHEILSVPPGKLIYLSLDALEHLTGSTTRLHFSVTAAAAAAAITVGYYIYNWHLIIVMCG